jgi:phospholipid/cholesterol/gamma-HCH transport system substrate-binding protein
MESTPKSQKKVGLFVTLGIFAIHFSILILGGDKGFLKSQVTYKVDFESVQGLNEGSVVSMSGLLVGNVAQFKISETSNSVTVQIKIDSEYAKKITAGTSAEIRTQGALGDKFIFITPGPSDAEILTPDSQLTVAKPSDLIGVISERGAETALVFDTIKEVHHLMKTINSANRVDKIVGNLANASENLSVLSKEGRSLIADLKSEQNGSLQTSLKRLDSVLTKIDNGEGTLGALINDPTLHEQLKGLLGTNPRKKYMKSLIQTSLEADSKDK